MKLIPLTLFLFLSFSVLGQIHPTKSLWRTKGVHDSLGNFISRAKIQSFLYSAESNQFYRLRTQDRMNMETGETKVFTYRDTLLLDSMAQNTFRINEKESLTLHTKDSLTIHYNGYSISYTRLEINEKTVSLKKLQQVLINKKVIETVESSTEYAFTYQDDDLVEVAPLDSKSKWKSDYKIIDFEGFLIIQGIVSAPKLVVKIQKKAISFLEIDYRFKTKKGTFQHK